LRLTRGLAGLWGKEATITATPLVERNGRKLHASWWEAWVGALCKVRLACGPGCSPTAPRITFSNCFFQIFIPRSLFFASDPQQRFSGGTYVVPLNTSRPRDSLMPWDEIPPSVLGSNERLLALEQEEVVRGTNLQGAYKYVREPAKWTPRRRRVQQYAGASVIQQRLC
jgi:hypothetical protein